MLALGLLFLLSFSVSAGGSNREEVTIDAAFRYNGEVFLISGDHFMAVTEDGFERYVKERDGSSGVNTSEHIQAAVTWPLKSVVHLYGPDGGYKNDQETLESGVFGYSAGRAFLQDGGPDAAAFKSGYFYIFKGCQFVAQRGTLLELGEPQEVETLGLPCNPDAAWTDTDLKGMTVLKASEIWIWREGEVTGPIPFDTKYHIYTWQLKHSLDHSFQL